MSEQAATRKPRLWLRLLLVLMFVLALVGALGYTKYQQRQDMIAQGSQVPPPMSVTAATAKAARWQRRIKAIGTLVAFQGVNVTTEVSGVITSINFDSGKEIKEASLLVELDNRTETANLEAAIARFDAADSQYRRLLKLKMDRFDIRSPSVS